MKVSVIVPVYNVADYIIKCMDSLINQTLKDIEIIVVNDGSPDNSIKLIEEKYNDDRIKIVYKKNGGLASARNSGVMYAKGEYLFFLDSDDFIALNTLEEMYNEALKEKSDIVFCDFYKYFRDDNKTPLKLIPFYDKENKKSIITGNPSACCKLIKRDLYLKYQIKFLEGYYFEDIAIMPFLHATTTNFSYVEKPFYYYFQREGSIINKTKYDFKWEDIFGSLENLKNKFISYNLYDSCYLELEYTYIEALLHAANLRFIDYPEGIKNIEKVAEIMKKDFPHFQKNPYYKKENFKYHIFCTLFYHKQIKILKLIRKIMKGRRSND